MAVDLDLHKDIPVARKENLTLRMIMAVLGFGNGGLEAVLCDKISRKGDGDRLVGLMVGKHGEGTLSGGSTRLWDSMDFEAAQGIPWRTGHRTMVYLSSVDRRAEVMGVARSVERDHTGGRDGD